MFRSHWRYFRERIQSGALALNIVKIKWIDLPILDSPVLTIKFLQPRGIRPRPNHYGMKGYSNHWMPSPIATKPLLPRLILNAKVLPPFRKRLSYSPATSTCNGQPWLHAGDDLLNPCGIVLFFIRYCKILSLR